MGRIHYKSTKTNSAYLFPVDSGTNSETRDVHVSRRTLKQYLGKEVRINSEVLNRGDEKKQRDGKVSFDIHIWTNELIMTKVLIGEHKLPRKISQQPNIYSLGRIDALIIFFPRSDEKSV